MRKDRLLRDSIRERFVVTMLNGDSFDGLLIEVDDKTFRLASASAISDTRRVGVDGELFLPRSNVAYLQRLGVGA